VFVIKLVINALIHLIHFQYEELNKMVTSVQSYLIRTREGLIEAINKLELQVIFMYSISKYVPLLYDFLYHSVIVLFQVIN